MGALTEIIQNAISENAHVAQDQEAYRRRYAEMATCFENVKTKHDELVETIERKKATRIATRKFLDGLTGLDDIIGIS